MPKLYDQGWLSFEAQIAGWMKEFARSGLRFSAGRQCIPGFPSDGFRADGALTDGQTLLALEVEVRQNHPDTNVGKYWYLFEHHAYKRVVLFHLFTPAFNSYGWHLKLGQFYADKMMAELPFEYVLMDHRRATDIAQTFESATSLIGARIRSEFSSSL